MLPSTHLMAFETSFVSTPKPVGSRSHEPICHGPSGSFPRYHILTPYGSLRPFLMRRSDQYVPPLWFVYSTAYMASFMPAVPRFSVYIGSAPMRSVHCRYSSCPMSFVIYWCHARSRCTRRCSLGPIESRQSQPETKLPSGKSYTGKVCFSKCFNDVASETLLVSRRMLWRVHHTVYKCSDRLKKSTIQTRRNLADWDKQDGL
jgi:hypothetical protein